MLQFKKGIYEFFISFFSLRAEHHNDHSFNLEISPIFFFNGTFGIGVFNIRKYRNQFYFCLFGVKIAKHASCMEINIYFPNLEIRIDYQRVDLNIDWSFPSIKAIIDISKK